MTSSKRSLNSKAVLNTRPKRISILGSTGSIGRSTLEIVRQFPKKFQIYATIKSVY